MLTAPEVQKVIQALRPGSIDIVEVHNHSFTEHPRLFSLNFWAVDDGVTVTKALRTALDATNLQPASWAAAADRRRPAAYEPGRCAMERRISNDLQHRVHRAHCGHQ